MELIDKCIAALQQPDEKHISSHASSGQESEERVQISEEDKKELHKIFRVVGEEQEK